MKTLVITKNDILNLVDIESLKNELIEGFINYSNGNSRKDGKRMVLDIKNGNTSTLLGPGTSMGIPAYTVKSNSKFPNEQMAIKGVIALFDIENGNLLALLDSALVTAIRTGLCAALATDHLSHPQAKKISIVGAGKQNILQLQYVLDLRDFEKIAIFDLDTTKAEEFANMFKDRASCEVAENLETCLAHTDVILTATWSKTPILNKALVPKPCHITSLGADEKGKVEVSKDLVLQSKFYCDDIELTMAMGTTGNLGLTKESIHAEIGEALAGGAQQHKNNDITIYSSVGLPFQDLVTAWHIYKKALGNENILSVEMN